MRYFRRSPLAQCRLALTDLGCLVRSWLQPPLPLPKVFEHILIANPAHLGDAVITTALIRALKTSNPAIKIDVLCGSWSKAIFENHPGVSDIYTLDMPALNRAKNTRQDKIAAYKSCFQELQKELKNKQYDLLASVYAYEPSYIPALCNLIKAPIIGFSSAGYSPLLTRTYNTKDLPLHEVQHQAQILECMLGEYQDLSEYKLWLPKTEKPIASPKSYVVIHPGSGDSSKEWDIECWREVVRFVVAQNYPVVITGHGKREELLAREIIKDLKVENQVGKLSFAQFSGYIEHARLVISVDSVAAHIASAHDVSAITLTLGKTELHRWSPLGNRATFLDWRSRDKSNDQALLKNLKDLITSKLLLLDIKEVIS